MSSAKQDFFAKEVTDAIQMACEKLGAPQEELNIEVVETGSSGIFGLIRKKAHIRAAVREAAQNDVVVSEKPDRAEDVVPARESKKTVSKVTEPASKKAEKPKKARQPEKKEKVEESEGGKSVEDSKPKVEKKKNSPAKPQPKSAEPVSKEAAEVVRQELSGILALMGFPSKVTAEVDASTVHCRVSEEYEEALSAQDGKIIDSLQYLLRKLVARKVEEKIRLSIDIGQFREKRKIELIERAKELAALVKEDGKTQAIPPLNPSERRIVHVVLQEDKEIRSRSVGGGLFKKILIYKPGKEKKSGANKRGGKGRGRGNSKKKAVEKPTTDE